jgi:hypothetical protein
MECGFLEPRDLAEGAQFRELVHRTGEMVRRGKSAGPAWV